MDLLQLLSTVQELCGNLVSKYGPWGVAAAMLFESAGIPFVSTAVLFTAGGMILSGRTSFWVLLLASTVGIITGSIVSYLIGYLGGSVGRVLGNFLNRRPENSTGGRIPSFSKVYPFMERYGNYSIFIGQFWGVTRTFISFPAGAMQMNLPLFILYTALGGIAFSFWVIGWSLIFTSAAGLLLKFLKILHLLSPWVWPILALLLAAFVFFYFRHHRFKI